MSRIALLAAAAILVTGCSYTAPQSAPVRYVAPVEVLPAPAPVVIDPPAARPRPPVLRRDPRIKYTTDPRCNYVRYDGSCMSARYPSYRIPGR